MVNLKKLKEIFSQVLLVFSEISTDKGIIAWNSEEDLKEGDEVFVVSEEGEKAKAEDGDYTAEDGKVISVVEGKVASIKDPEAEVAPEVLPKTQDEIEMGCGGKKEQKLEDEVEVEVKPEENPMEDSKPEEEIKMMLGELLKKLVALEERVAKIEESPAAGPVAEEFKKAVESKSTGNEKLDFYRELARSGRE